MGATAGQKRLYSTLLRVLDSIRNEAPQSNADYHPVAGNPDALIHARSRALLHLFLKSRFGMSDFSERERHVTDGTQDGGIDAYYIDKRAKVIYLLQSKFRTTATNFVAEKMSDLDILKMDVKEILEGAKKDSHGINYNIKITGRLQKDIKALPDPTDYSKKVILLGNVKKYSPAQLKKLVAGYDTEEYPHDRAYLELLFPVINGTYFDDPKLSVEIRLDNITAGDSHLSYSAKTAEMKTNIKIVFVPTKEIGRVMSSYRNTILKFNPRSFLELTDNPVNADIEATVRGKTGNDFALLNNGITIISDNASISSETATPKKARLTISSPQLVNGGQSAYTLARIYDSCKATGDFSVFNGKEVLLKVISIVPKAPGAKVAEGDYVSLVSSISKASNSQTKIDESDRRSNDPVQMTLQHEFFAKHGLYYERKLGEFADGLAAGYISVDQLVDRQRMVRIALAIEYKLSAARSSIKPHFNVLALPNVLNVSKIDAYAYANEVFAVLEAKRKAPPKAKGDRYHMQEYGHALRYGTYAVIAAAVNLGQKKHKTALQSTEAILAKWLKFEVHVEKLVDNSTYGVNGAFDFVNYYKGSTIDSDVQKYQFKV